MERGTVRIELEQKSWTVLVHSDTQCPGQDPSLRAPSWVLEVRFKRLTLGATTTFPFRSTVVSSCLLSLRPTNRWQGVYFIWIGEEIKSVYLFKESSGADRMVRDPERGEAERSQRPSYCEFIRSNFIALLLPQMINPITDLLISTLTLKRLLNFSYSESHKVTMCE